MTVYDPRQNAAGGAIPPPPPPPPKAAVTPAGPANGPAPAPVNPSSPAALPATYPGAASTGIASGQGPGGAITGFTKAPVPVAPAPAPAGGVGGGGQSWAQPIKDPVSDFSSQIMSTLQAQLAPGAGPWDANTADAALQGNVEQRASADKQSRDAILRNAVASGLGRSSSTQALLAQAHTANSSAFGAANRDVQKNAVLQNYQARVQALDQSMKYIDQARNWVLASDKSMMDKQELLAKLSMAGASAAAQQQEMQMRVVGMMMGETNQQPNF